MVVKASIILAKGWEPSERAGQRIAEPREKDHGALQIPAHRRIRRRAPKTVGGKSSAAKSATQTA
ncbi:MAG: hypothetical protein ACLT98_15005 [Eggerthellaceae bacterium]